MLDEIESKYMSNINKKEYKILIEKQEYYVKKIYTKFNKILELEIVKNEEFGLNFSFTGSTGLYYFPAIIWYTQSYKEVKKRIVKLSDHSPKNISDLTNKIFEIVLKEVKTRSGYTIELLECLNFFTKVDSGNLYNSQKMDIDEIHFLNYRPRYLSSFSNEIINNNFSTVTQSLGSYLIPNNTFWNLGSILLEPSFDYDNYAEFYPVLPYWSIQKKNNGDLVQNLFSVHRISPKYFRNNFDFKKQIVNSIIFFINLQFFNKSDSNLFVYKLPDLFKQFDIFENQNFVLSENNFKTKESLLKPNWYLPIKSPKKIKLLEDRFDNVENEQVNNFLSKNLNIIIHLYNIQGYSKLFSINKTLDSLNRKNIFNNLFEKRLRLDKNNLNIFIIIWIKMEKKRQKNYKSIVINFFSSIFPTGTIINYQSGIVFYLSLYDKNKSKFLSILVKFLDFLNFEYEIYDNFINNKFLLYTLPTSNLFLDGEWNLPQTRLKISKQEFVNIRNTIIQNEKKLRNLDENRKKIKDFEDFFSRF